MYDEAPAVPQGMDAFSRWFSVAGSAFSTGVGVFLVQGAILWAATYGISYAGGALLGYLGGPPTVMSRFYGWEDAMAFYADYFARYGGFIAGGTLISLAAWIIQLGFLAGMYRTALKHLRGEHVQVDDIFGAFGLAPAMLGLHVLAGMAIVVGGMFLCVPGALLGGLWLLSTPILVERRSGVFGSMAQSWRIGKRNLLLFACYGTLVAVLMVVGSLRNCFGLLSIITAPFTVLCIAVAYADIQYQRDPVVADQPPAYIPPPYAGPMPPPPPPGTTPEPPPRPQP